MFRPRRYRVLVVFTAVTILIILNFVRIRDWDAASDEILHSPAPASPPPQNPPPQKPVEDTKAAPPPSDADGSADAARPPEKIEVPGPGGGKVESQTDPPRGGTNQKPAENPTVGQTASTQGEQSTEEGKDKDIEKDNENPMFTVNKPETSKLESESSRLDSETEGLEKLESTQSSSSSSSSSKTGGKTTPHWKKLTEQFPIAAEDMIKLPTGKSKDLPKLQARFKDESVTDKLERQQRMAAVKAAFEHAWNGYKSSAMGHDEVAPLRGGYRDPFNGWGATLVDGLDTLWIMDMKDEFSLAVDEVKKIDFTTSSKDTIPVFETAIRYLGGLLGAYDISGHKYTVLLDKATELADILIGAFDTPNRMPMLYYAWAPENVSRRHRADPKAVLAEIGSLSVEFTRLAQLTRESKYYDAIARITNALEKSQDSTKLPGLWPLKLNSSGCKKSTQSKSGGREVAQESTPDRSTPSNQAEKAIPTDKESYEKFFDRRDGSSVHRDAQPADYPNLLGSNSKSKADSEDSSFEDCRGGLASPSTGSDTFGLGAMADSTYEYMPKEYMLLGGLNEQYRKMYEKAMDTARKYLLFQPMVKDDRDLRFLATVESRAGRDPEGWSWKYQGEHLTCFAGGMFGLGAKLFDIKGDLDIAAQLTDGCVWAYESTATGIMPESFDLLPCDKGESCAWNETRYRKALDPHEESRFYRAQRLQENNAQLSQDSESKGTTQKDTLSSSSSSSSSSLDSATEYGQGYVAKRELPAADEQQGTSSTFTSKTDNQLSRESLSPLEKISVVDHGDFVDSRIQNERIPPGFLQIVARKYLLRPEAIESVFLMYRLTGNEYWREKGWAMFEAINKHTRTQLAHSAIQDVTTDDPRPRDEMESFWLAETLKYFYLLFADPSVVSLDEYVLNTEAHPMKRPEY